MNKGLKILTIVTLSFFLVAFVLAGTNSSTNSSTHGEINSSQIKITEKISANQNSSNETNERNQSKEIIYLPLNESTCSENKTNSSEGTNTSETKKIEHKSEDKTPSKKETNTLTYKRDEENTNSSSPSYSTNEKITQEKTKISLYKDGKKVIEGTIPSDFTGEIKKETEEINENKERVVVKSDEHLPAPLKVYEDISETKNKENIHVFWKNEEKEVKIEDYIDSNNDGRIDRISWIVPHLSEQVFEITINPDTGDSSTELIAEIENINPNQNPLTIQIKVNYTSLSDVKCNISVENSSGERKTESFENLNPGSNPFNLSDLYELGVGNTSIELFCWDKTNSSIKGNDSKIVQIDEKPFEITGINESGIYLGNIDIPFDIQSEGTVTGDLLNGSTGETIISGVPLELKKILSIFMGDAGKYILKIGEDFYAKKRYRNVSFYVIKAEMDSNATDILVGETVKLIFDFERGTKNIPYILINFGDGQNDTILYTEDSFDIFHTYTKKGIYHPNMSFWVENTPFTVQGPTINVVNPSDLNPAPTLELIYPKENEIINSKSITFEYKASDDKKVSECRFELWMGDGDYKTEDYHTTKVGINNNETNKVQLTSFDDGNYTWIVLCKDNESKEVSKTGHFVVKTQKHDKEKVIEDAQDNLNEFMKKIDSFNMDEKEALESLGIDKDLTYYSKRLVQIDQDLGTNLKFISNETLREKRRKETIEELNQIVSKIPTDFKIEDSTEYIKNSLTANIEEIVSKYLEANHIQLSQRQIKELVEKNTLLQEKISPSIKIEKIKITYTNGSEEIFLVQKKIRLDNINDEIILEVLPEDIQGVSFNTQSQELSKNFFEIKPENMEGRKIVYSVKGKTDIDELKGAETILFDDKPSSSKGMTGYFSLSLDPGKNSLYYIIILIVLIVAGYFGKDFLAKIRLNNWRREENVRRIEEYSLKARRALEADNTEVAKQYYHQIKEIYPLVPKGFRNYSWPTIKKIRIGIDKRDMMEFVKEYEKAKKEGREEDVKRLYKNIQNQYKKLPTKYQQKVYERVIKEHISNEFTL